MDEIQKVLVKAGRKDLAQKYYKKVAGANSVLDNFIGATLEKHTLTTDKGKVVLDFVTKDGKKRMLDIIAQEDQFSAHLEFGDHYSHQTHPDLSGKRAASFAINEQDIKKLLEKYKLSDFIGILGNYLSENGYSLPDVVKDENYDMLIDRLANSLLEYYTALKQSEA